MILKLCLPIPILFSLELDLDFYTLHTLLEIFIILIIHILYIY